MHHTTHKSIAGNAFSVHYFLRPDHRDIADLWLASSGHMINNIDADNGREWLFLHIENLHISGAQTACAFNRQTGGLAGFVTVHPGNGSLDQIIVAQTDRGSGVAALLLDEAKTLASGAIEMRISEDNQRAMRFCEREGFRKTGLDASASGGARMWKMRWQPGDAE
mgnify:FL=1